MGPSRRLAFITPKLDLESVGALGIRKKVQGQVRAFRKLGFHAEPFWFAPFSYRSGNPLGAGSYFRARYGELLEQVRAFAPDAVYVRYAFSDRPFLRFLGQLRGALGQVPVYLEIATFPYDRELRSGRSPGLLALYLADRLCRGGLHRHVDRVVTFGDREEIFGIPTLRIGNGVDTGAFPPAGGESGEGDTLHLIGVSNLAFWTGYERLVAGLAGDRRRQVGREVVFHVVGDGPGRASLEELAAREGLGERVRFHGPRAGEDLDALFRGSHLAIGNLGVHRKGMTVNPDLKNREYCARGIPFVTSTVDPGFPPGFPFLLQAPADESPVGMVDLIDFHDEVRRRHPEYVGEMRDFARRNLDWTVMLEPVAKAVKCEM